jgi:NAD(P)-dependent dehydrogenase (short-subunit alcohol dehydrogenase family)
MRLSGKVAIITGAASGIGRATAIRFANEGARVVVADINEDGARSCVAEINAGGGEAIVVKTDVSREDDIRRTIDSAVEEYGGLDVLHNNAYWTEFATAVDTTIENWRQTHDVTLRAVYLASKFAVPHLRRRSGGVIINTASVQSIVGVPGFAAYQAAKGGVLSLTRALALELAPEIRVAAILPGAIDTPALHVEDEEGFDAWVERSIPLKRIGRPDEIANIALFLASDEASYVTGTGFVADGGYSTQ